MILLIFGEHAKNCRSYIRQIGYPYLVVNSIDVIPIIENASSEAYFLWAAVSNEKYEKLTEIEHEKNYMLEKYPNIVNFRINTASPEDLPETVGAYAMYHTLSSQVKEKILRGVKKGFFAMDKNENITISLPFDIGYPYQKITQNELDYYLTRIPLDVFAGKAAIDKNIRDCIKDFMPL